MADFFTDLFGTRPKVPIYTPVNQQAAQASSIAANIANLAQSAKLAEGVSAANRKNQASAIRSAVGPGYDEANQLISGNYLDALKGVLPKGILNRLQTMTAERAGQGGFAGGGAQQNLNTAVTAETMLARADAAAPAYQRWSQTKTAFENPAMMDVQSMFVNPQVWTQNEIQGRQDVFNRDWMAAQIKAMPDPRTKGITSLGMQTMGGLMTAMGSGGGGSGGGGY